MRTITALGACGHQLRQILTCSYRFHVCSDADQPLIHLARYCCMDMGPTVSSEVICLFTVKSRRSDQLVW